MQARDFKNRCGMHSHISVVQNGRRDYVIDIGRDRCQKLIDHGTITIGLNNDVLAKIRVNRTTPFSVTLAGEIDKDGYCKGVRYSDPYGIWNDAVAVTIKNLLHKVYR